MIEYT